MWGFTGLSVRPPSTDQIHTHTHTQITLFRAPLTGRPFLSALGAGLLVHAASNLANTYYDFVSGKKNKKSGRAF